MNTMQRLPTSTEYSEAIQHPQYCFQDPKLKVGSVTRRPNGTPFAMSGNFAVVFKLDSPTRSWAVRCFYRNAPDTREKYRAISEHLRDRRHPDSALIEFEYISEGIRIGSQWYPIVIMDWVDGLAIDSAVHQALSNPAKIGRITEQWLKLDRELVDLKIAHGDLQHGNVLVTDETLRLVDYDGMYVPALEGFRSSEIGHANYQPPWRTSEEYSPNIDRFSSLAIYTALRALQTQWDLWPRYKMPDDALLFRKQDFADPMNSQLFDELLRSKDPVVSGLAALVKSATIEKSSIPPLAELVKQLESPPAASFGNAPWWSAQPEGTQHKADANEEKPQVERRSIKERMRAFLTRGSEPAPTSSTREIGSLSKGLQGSAPDLGNRLNLTDSTNTASAARDVQPSASSGIPTLSLSTQRWWEQGQNIKDQYSSTVATSVDPGHHQPIQPAAVRLAPNAVSSKQTTSQPVAPAITQAPQTSSSSVSTSNDVNLKPTVLIASRDRQKFHLPGCEYGSQISQSKRVQFSSVADAEAAGYSACRVCNPIRSTRPPSNQLPLPKAVSVRGNSISGPQIPSSIDKVTIGRTVVVRFDDGATGSYLMVDRSRARTLPNQCKVDTPFGMAVMNKEVGERVEYKVGASTIKCTITAIK